MTPPAPGDERPSRGLARGSRRHDPGAGGRSPALRLLAPSLRVLAADLRDLALDLQAASYTRTTLAMFQHDLRRAVPSALGATISFDLDAPTGVPKEINLVAQTLDPAEIAAGLRIPLILPQQSLVASVLFYASEPDAFRDVVLSLTTLLDLPVGLMDESPTLPADPVSPSVVAVEDFSLVNEALGVLINRGFTLTEARSDLQDRATAARTGLPGAARLLLDGLPTRHGRRAGRLRRSIVPTLSTQPAPLPGADGAGPEGPSKAGPGERDQSRSSPLFLNQRVTKIIRAARNGSTPRA